MTTRAWWLIYVAIMPTLWFATGALIGTSWREVAAQTIGFGLRLSAMLGGS
jgi:hypothetical protein